MSKAAERRDERLPAGGSKRPWVWVVSELYYPEDTSTGYFLTGIAEGLAAEFSTGVICSQPTYSARGQRAPRRETRNGVTIVRGRNTRLDRTVLPFRIINMLTISAAVFTNALLRLRRRDVVIVVTNPPTLPLVVRIAAKLRGARAVLLVHDVYPEVLAASGLLRQGSLAYRVAARITRSLYRGFERVIVLGRDMRELVAGKLDDPSRITIIPNWGDPERIQPRTAPNPLRERLGLREKFVVQYGGNIGRTHGIDALLAAARTLRDADPTVHFLIVGSGARKVSIESAIASGELPNVTLLGTVPREELPISLTACDLALVTLLPGMKGVSVPSRLYNIFAAGAPVVAMADVDSELGLAVSEEDAGWVIAPGDADALVRVIEEARHDAPRLVATGARARSAAEAKYSQQRIVDAWVAFVRSLGIE